LLIIICKNVLEKTPLGSEGKMGLLISVIISILAVRFISENNLIEGILIPYGTLGIAITTILPLVIFFYFVHHTNVGTFGRKFFWMVFAIILLILWVSKYDQIGDTANRIYGLVLLATALLVVFDKSVHSYLGLSDFRKFDRDSNKKRILQAKKELDEIEEHFQKRRMSWQDYRQEKKQLEDYIKELSKE
jgi:hypothetical protein